MFETWCTIIVIVVAITYPKIKKEMEFKEMQRESEYCAKHGIKTDVNKVINASCQNLTQSQYRKLYASGALREDKKEEKK